MLNNDFEKYIFKVGEQGFKRLEILNDICNPHSLKFLQDQRVLKPGIRVLEIGCGTGQMSSLIAKQITSSGQVDAIDINHEQLSLAKRHLNENNIHNVNLYQLSAYELENTLCEKYDLIYSRLLLMHLKQPEKVLNSFKKIIKKNGAIISEDSEATSYECSPHSDVFDQWLKIRLPLFHFNINFGREASDLYKQCHYTDLTVHVNQPLLQLPEQRAFMRHAILEHEKELVGKGKAFQNESEIKIFLENLIKLESDFHYTIKFMRMFQICVKGFSI